MKRVRIDLIFPDTEEGDSRAGQLMQTLDYYLTLKVKNLVKELSYIEIHDCHHEEIPERPCENFERFDCLLFDL